MSNKKNNINKSNNLISNPIESQIQYNWNGPMVKEEKGNIYYNSLIINYTANDKYILNVNDTILLQSDGPLPYIAIIIFMSEKKSNNNKYVHCRWFFRPQDIMETSNVSNKTLEIINNCKYELFYSPYLDINEVESILRPCNILFLSYDQELPTITRNSRDTFVCRYSFDTIKGINPLTSKELQSLTSNSKQSMIQTLIKKESANISIGHTNDHYHDLDSVDHDPHNNDNDQDNREILEPEHVHDNNSNETIKFHRKTRNSSSSIGNGSSTIANNTVITTSSSNVFEDMLPVTHRNKRIKHSKDSNDSNTNKTTNNNIGHEEEVNNITSATNDKTIRNPANNSFVSNIDTNKHDNDIDITTTNDTSNSNYIISNPFISEEEEVKVVEPEPITRKIRESSKKSYESQYYTKLIGHDGTKTYVDDKTINNQPINYKRSNKSIDGLENESDTVMAIAYEYMCKNMNKEKLKQLFSNINDNKQRHTLLREIWDNIPKYERNAHIRRAKKYISENDISIQIDKNSHILNLCDNVLTKRLINNDSFAQVDRNRRHRVSNDKEGISGISSESSSISNNLTNEDNHLPHSDSYREFNDSFTTNSSIKDNHYDISNDQPNQLENNIIDQSIYHTDTNNESIDLNNSTNRQYSANRQDNLLDSSIDSKIDGLLDNKIDVINTNLDSYTSNSRYDTRGSQVKSNLLNNQTFTIKRARLDEFKYQVDISNIPDVRNSSYKIVDKLVDNKTLIWSYRYIQENILSNQVDSLIDSQVLSKVNDEVDVTEDNSTDNQLDNPEDIALDNQSVNSQLSSQVDSHVDSHLDSQADSQISGQVDIQMVDDNNRELVFNDIFNNYIRFAKDKIQQLKSNLYSSTVSNKSTYNLRNNPNSEDEISNILNERVESSHIDSLINSSTIHPNYNDNLIINGSLVITSYDIDMKLLKYLHDSNYNHLKALETIESNINELLVKWTIEEQQVIMTYLDNDHEKFSLVANLLPNKNRKQILDYLTRYVFSASQLESYIDIRNQSNDSNYNKYSKAGLSNDIMSLNDSKYNSKVDIPTNHRSKRSNAGFNSHIYNDNFVHTDSYFTKRFHNQSNSNTNAQMNEINGVEDEIVSTDVVKVKYQMLSLQYLISLKKLIDNVSYTEIMNSLLCYNKQVITASQVIVRMKSIFITCILKTEIKSINELNDKKSNLFDDFSKFLPESLRLFLC